MIYNQQLLNSLKRIGIVPNSWLMLEAILWWVVAQRIQNYDMRVKSVDYTSLEDRKRIYRFIVNPKFFFKLIPLGDKEVWAWPDGTPVTAYPSPPKRLNSHFIDNPDDKKELMDLVKFKAYLIDPSITDIEVIFLDH